MKKIILFNMVALLVASAAYAAGVSTNATHSISTTFANAGLAVVGTGGSATGAAIGKLSTKVELGWLTQQDAYVINTQHQQGTKSYGTSFDSTSIYVIDTAAGTPVAFGTGTGSNAFSGWTTM